MGEVAAEALRGHGERFPELWRPAGGQECTARHNADSTGERRLIRGWAADLAGCQIAGGPSVGCRTGARSQTSQPAAGSYVR